MTDVLGEFRRDQVRRGLAKSTIDQYASRLRSFERWLRRPIGAATEGHIQLWLDTRRLGPSARRTYISTLAAFYQWATRHGHAETDPTANILRPRVPRRIPRPMTPADLATALEEADPRIACWLMLANYAGLRCVEIANLRREDVLLDRDPPMLFVVGKGSHEREVPLHSKAEAALRAYGLPRSGPVFARRCGRAVDPGTVSHYIARYLHAQGIASTAHKGRHAFATAVYRATHDLRLVQELLGHSSPATTAIYTSVDPQGGVDVVRNLA